MSDTQQAKTQKANTDSTAAANADVAALSYEQAREQLMGVVNQLEAGSSSLEDSLALWERGEALAQRCEEWLQGAKARLDAARAEKTAAQPDG